MLTILRDMLKIFMKVQECATTHSTVRTLSRFLAGETGTLSVAHFRALARVLGVSVSQLIGESSLVDDPRVSKVVAAMAKMPEDKKDVMVAICEAMAGSGGTR